MSHQLRSQLGMGTMAKSTTEQAVDHWSDDVLGRAAESDLLISFLTARMEERTERGVKGSYVLNLDAGWGQGKTYFLERFRKDLEKYHPVAYVNAWEDDHAEDPLIAIMAAISAAFESKTAKAVVAARETLLKKTGKVAFIVAKHGLLTLGKRAIGEGVGAVAEALGDGGVADAEEAAKAALEEALSTETEAAISRFESAKETIADFKNALSALSTKHNDRKPLFVLIDELDRCRPSYAISLLERIKHLFDTDNIVFVIATDTSQLRHAVTAVYGAGFDGAGYLLRFFNRTYTFAEPEIEPFVKSLFLQYQTAEDALSFPPDITAVKFFTQISRGFKLNLREVERCHDVMRSAITVWHSARGPKLHAIYLLPLIIAYCRRDEELWSALLSLAACRKRFRRFSSAKE